MGPDVGPVFTQNSVRVYWYSIVSQIIYFALLLLNKYAHANSMLTVAESSTCIRIVMRGMEVTL